MSEKIDPELVDDRDVHEEDIAEIDLPEYDPSEFELPDEYEYVEVDEEGDSDASENEA